MRLAPLGLFVVKNESRSVVSLFATLQARILEWGSLFLLQGIFPTQGSNPGLLHCRPILYQLSHKRSCLWLGLSERWIKDGQGQIPEGVVSPDKMLAAVSPWAVGFK